MAFDVECTFGELSYVFLVNPKFVAHDTSILTHLIMMILAGNQNKFNFFSAVHLNKLSLCVA